MPTAFAEFPGLTDVIQSISMPLIHGIAPGVGQIIATPFQGFAATVGDLVLRYDTTEIRFKDCAISRPTLRGGANAPRQWSLAILDRRWRWQYGSISGRYNAKQPDGEVDETTEKTPQELATLLLEAMSEQGFDVSSLPAKPRPFVHWHYANPARELQTLCEYLGHRVILGLNDRVKLVEVGQGSPLPTTGLELNLSYGVDRAIVPDKIRLVGGDTLWQVRLKLEAVGRDVDGSIKPIRELSYQPTILSAAHHGFLDPKDHLDVVTTDGARELAKQTVYRWYRAIGFDASGLDVPGLGVIDSMAKVVMQSVQVETETGPNNEKIPKPPRVVGYWYDDDLAWRNSVAGDELAIGFSIDGQNGLVKFSQPVYGVEDSNTRYWPGPDTNGRYVPAALFVDCAVKILDANDNPIVYTRERDVPGGTPAGVDSVLIVNRPEFVDYRIQQYGDTILERRIGPHTTLTNALDQQADEYLESIETQQLGRESVEVQYAGLLPINLDGLTEHVSYSFGVGSPAITVATQNSEHGGQAPYKERRLRQKLQDLVEGRDRNQERLHKRDIKRIHAAIEES